MGMVWHPLCSHGEVSPGSVGQRTDEETQPGASEGSRIGSALAEEQADARGITLMPVSRSNGDILSVTGRFL